MVFDHRRNPPKAILVSILLQGVTDQENTESLAELARLAKTLGYDVLTTFSQRRPSVSSASVVGEGKLEEIVKIIQDKTSDSLEESSSKKVSAIIFDGELTPSQMANLQTATGVEVLDRTGVIVEIFSKHAKTRESRLQVEIARLKYLSPRMRETNGPIGERGSSKIGESKLELDRRKIRDRISELKNELSQIQKTQAQRHTRRSDQPCVALVGYTNAGKSSLMRALTGSDVLVEDKLFATLDTTVRALYPESIPKILISDTVGFIKKLPHDLVASFRSTLEEAANAELLLFVVDVSDSTFRSQLDVTRQVLNEIGVNNIPQKLILNKIDRLNAEHLSLLKQEFPDGIFLSTLDPNDVKQLREVIIEFFEQDMFETQVFIPYSDQNQMAEIRKHVRVLKEWYDENGTHLEIRSTQAFIDKLKKR